MCNMTSTTHKVDTWGTVPNSYSSQLYFDQATSNVALQRAVLMLLFKRSSLCFKKDFKILCWSLPLVCVYLSLHHIAARDTISARGSPTSSLQTTSDQNLDGGEDH